VDTPFLAINADDFYGRPAVAAAGEYLSALEENSTRFCMAGFRLESTLSENGSVSRGVCRTDAEGLLLSVREHTKLERVEGRIIDSADGSEFQGTERVSMNCWGFTPAVFPLLEKGLKRFLEAHSVEEKSEFYIPSAVAEMIDAREATVRVLPVESPWFGVTYREDRPVVAESLAKLSASGEYPSPLW
jgi:hypothetical protein